MTFARGLIFISIMNRGVYRIDYNCRAQSFQMDSFLKSDLASPQSLYLNESLNELSIVDYIDGLIVINIRTGELTENDYFRSKKPNKVISFRDGKTVVQTRSSLYVIKNSESSVVIDSQVANVTSYYNHIYYSKGGIVHRMKI